MRTFNRTPADARPVRPIKLRVYATPAAAPADMAAWQRGRDAQLARIELDDATAAYAIACKALGEANRRLGKRSNCGVFSMTQRLGWRADAFRAINRARSRMTQARKQLASLGAL